MAQTIYENYPASHARTMETEDTFANGMKYVSHSSKTFFTFG